jgi:hypothetical protein
VVAVALVHLVHRQAEAAVQLAGEALRAAGVVVRRAVGVHRARRPPARRVATRRSAGDGAKRASPSAAIVVSGLAWRSRRVAGGHAHPLEAEIEGHESVQA